MNEKHKKFMILKLFVRVMNETEQNIFLILSHSLYTLDVHIGYSNLNIFE